MSAPALHGYLLVATIPSMIMKRSWIAILTLLTQLVDQHAQQTIEYLKEENRILLHRLGRKRLILTDQERRILAVKANHIIAGRLRHPMGFKTLRQDLKGNSSRIDK